MQVKIKRLNEKYGYCFCTGTARMPVGLLLLQKHILVTSWQLIHPTDFPRLLLGKFFGWVLHRTNTI
jgi:hypothetical protein